ncbi:glycoside hydrolase family 2 TIM barrel-domain containing protein [Leifsonia xyli]|uniref:glycoside hydrolase family 2 TIM barrel-domain containing protein n=1 Tax=Leifsonia xyli TaxID=1575 RepID=UPI001CB84888|nr:glycoside hydrolase family 2 TIM barrel-domain containing protein [Leifsonia xyli]
MRSTAVRGGEFVLNDRQLYLRSVLYQGYWTESHLASPSAAALRADVELIAKLGFNAVRIHQKIEDPRFLHWTDRLGIFVWGEAPGAYEFGPRALERTTSEWLATLDRDHSHPSIVTWVPLNESWGMQHIAASRAQREFARGLAALTRAVDPTRPVISNDGWEHVDSDMLTLHDYEADPAVVCARYRDAAARERLLSGAGPAGRAVTLDDQGIGERPFLLTEFGGISFTTTYTGEDAWGYSTAANADEFADRIAALVGAVRESDFLARFC